MRRRRSVRRLALTLPLIVLLAGCTAVSPAVEPEPQLDVRDRSAWSGPVTFSERDHELWNSTVGVYLKDDLWTDRDAYDAGHVLMAPLDAAFRSGDAAWQDAFASQFAAFVANKSTENSTVTQQALGYAQYLYLASRFLHKAAQGDRELVPEGLADIVLNHVEKSWLVDDAWQWDAPAFRGMRERLMWKLNTSDVKESYYRALIDEELFALAIAAEYRAYEMDTTPPEEWSPVVTDILVVTRRATRQETTAKGEGWLLQTGVWEDHRDFAYAGHASVKPGMQPIPRDDVSTDSSHAARWPLWLQSFRDSYERETLEYEEYDRTLDRLSNQFLEKILVAPSDEYPYFRMNNYIDGWNGLFRWNYETAGANNGYGPFELSGSLIEIWWGMLPDARVASVYCDLAETFPLPDDAVKLYVGPNTTRDRHPLVRWPEYFSNGFAELSARLSCRLGRG